MKVYILSEGKINTGYESSIKCVCANLKLAEHIQKSFEHYNLEITEFDVIE